MSKCAICDKDRSCTTHVIEWPDDEHMSEAFRVNVCVVCWDVISWIARIQADAVVSRQLSATTEGKRKFLAQEGMQGFLLRQCMTLETDARVLRNALQETEIELKLLKQKYDALIEQTRG